MRSTLMPLPGLLLVVILASACFLNQRNDKVEVTNNKNTTSAHVANQPSNHSQIEWSRLPGFKCISFSSKNRVWATSAKKWEIYLTEDGGNTWRSLEDRKAGCIDFIDENNGWLMGNGYKLWSSNDGGTTWNQILMNIELSSIEQIKFTDTSTGWILDNYNVYKTQDGGLTWETKLSYKDKYLRGQPGKIFSLDSQTAFVCDAAGIDGWLYGTRNGGNDWFAKKMTQNKLYPCSIFFKNQNEGWYSLGPRAFFTIDGGQNWNSLNSLPQNFEVRSMFWFDSKEGWLAGFFQGNISESPALGRGGLLYTSDGGKNWTEIRLNSDDPFFEKVYFFDHQDGWLISRDNIYKTSDGGRTWKLSLNLPL